MTILISYDENAFEVPLADGGHLALYAVPPAYSGDGLFLATWNDGELEPRPACAVPDARPLLHLSCREGAIHETFKAEGVSYA